VNKELLQKAAKSLVPAGVLLRSTKVDTHPEFHRQMEQPENLQVQYRARHLNEYKLMLTEEENQGIMAFFFEASIRLVDDSIDEKDDAFVKVEIVATFASEYILSNANDFDEDAMSEFLNHNVQHHIWPYWREYVQSTCARMGLPAVPVPHQFYSASASGKKVDKKRG